jgi:tetratricopeptide (TPR) repeat protein
MRSRFYFFWAGWAILCAAVLHFPLAPGTRAQSQPADEQPTQEPPWKRVLTGDDAKRVHELQQKVEELWKAAKDTEAQAVAREILTIRTRVQGAGHWETEDAQRRIRTLAQIAALAPVARAELVEADKKTAEAERLHEQGKHTEAEPLFCRALEIRRHALGEHHPDTATSYSNVGANLNAQGKHAEAEPLLRKALEIHRKALGEDHPDTAASYNNVAGNLGAQGKHAEAGPLFRQALEIWRKALGEDHLHTANGYNNMAGNLGAQGKHAEAGPLFRQALEIWRKALGEDHLHTAYGYNNVAGNLNSRGKHAEADPLYRLALEIRRKALGQDHYQTATSYNNVAVNLASQGKHAEAEPLFRLALEIRRKALGEDHYHTATSYNNVAVNLNARGKYAEAGPLFRKALEIRRKALGQDHPDTAQSYNNVAANLDSQRKYAEAGPLYRQALEIYRRALGEDHPDTAASYSNLADNLRARGKHAEAEPLCRQALEIRRKALGEDHPDTAASYRNVAANLDDQGEYAEAEPLCRRALEIWRKALGEDHPDTAYSYNGVAYNLNAQGKYAEAEALWTQAARSFESVRLQVASTGLERASFGARTSPLPPLAAVLARQGKHAGAWQPLEANFARGLFDDLTSQLPRLASPEERDRLHELFQKLRSLEVRGAALLDKVSPMQACADASLAGQVMVPLCWGSTGPSAPAQAILQSTFYLGWSHRQKVNALLGQRLTVQSELSQFERELVAKYGVAQGQIYDLTRIQAQLPGDVALLAWVDIRPRGRKAADPGGEHWACIVRRRGEPIWVRLPGSGADQTWAAADYQLPKQVRDALVKPLAKAASRWRDLAAQLYRQRLAPLAAGLGATPDLPAVRHLIILPSPALAGLPVEVLVEARTDNQPRYSISYAPSATVFAWLKEQHHGANAEASHPGSARLLALGDPVFTRPDQPTAPAPQPPDHGALLTLVTRGANAAQSGLQLGDVLLSYAGTKLSGPADLRPAMGKAGQGDSGIAVTVWRAGRTLDLTVRPGALGVNTSAKPAAEAVRESREADALLQRTRGKAFTPLPGTRREVEAIARLFAQPETLLGSQASEQALEKIATADRLREFRYLHFATHGVLDHTVALRSALILSQDGLADPLEQVLSGKEVYNGQVTAERILRTWKLDADLVTLSACQTGLGQLRGGEGYLGFAQALFLAGARSMVLSLWKVDDDPTALLMTRFYQNLLGQRPGLSQPLPKALALEEAKHWLRNLTTTEVARLRPRGEKESVDEILSEPSGVRPYEHPYYWAAFILIGDPGDLSPEPASQPSSTRWVLPSVIGACVLVGALLIGVVARVRRRKPV